MAMAVYSLNPRTQPNVVYVQTHLDLLLVLLLLLLVGLLIALRRETTPAPRPASLLVFLCPHVANLLRDLRQLQIYAIR